MRLQNMIDKLTARADDSELIALLATTRKARLENVALARELRDVVGVRKRELHHRQTSAVRQLAEIRVGSPKILAQSDSLSVSDPPTHNHGQVGRTVMAMQIVMDHTGDTRHCFNADDVQELAKAEKRFKKLTGMGFTAAVRTASGEVTKIRSFDPAAEETLFFPRLVGG